MKTYQIVLNLSANLKRKKERKKEKVIHKKTAPYGAVFKP